MCWLAAQSQATNRLEGYILPSEGDTLFGEVGFVNPIHNQISVTFKPYGETRSRTYHPQDLVAYAFWNVGNRGHDALVTYRRKRIPLDPVEGFERPRDVFLQVISEGDLDLYHCYTLDIQYINDRQYIRTYFVEDLSPEGGIPLTQLTRENFREIAPQVLARNSYLTERLGTAGYGFKYLPEMVHFHNSLNDPSAHWITADQ